MDYKWFNGEISTLQYLTDPYERLDFLKRKRRHVMSLGASETMLKEFDRIIAEEKHEIDLNKLQKTNKNPVLSISQIALLFVYKGDSITKINMDLIANDYGHRSGHKLYQKFSEYSSPANRKAKPDPLSKKKLQNKINLFESVIELLPIEKQGRIKDEVNILKQFFETEYS